MPSPNFDLKEIDDAVQKTARRYPHAQQSDLDDLKQTVALRLLLAAANQDLDFPQSQDHVRRAYIYRTVRNCLADLHRQSSKRREAESKHTELCLASSARSNDLAPADFAEEIRTILNRAKPHLTDAATLSAIIDIFAGKSTAEIFAREFGLSRATAYRKILHTATILRNIARSE